MNRSLKLKGGIFLLRIDSISKAEDNLSRYTADEMT